MTIKTSKSGGDFPGCIVLDHGLKSFRLLQQYVQCPPLDLKSSKAEHQSPWSSELLSCSMSPKALHKTNGLLSSHHSREAVSRQQVHSRPSQSRHYAKKWRSNMCWVTFSHPCHDTYRPKHQEIEIKHLCLAFSKCLTHRITKQNKLDDIWCLWILGQLITPCRLAEHSISIT